MRDGHEAMLRLRTRESQGGKQGVQGYACKVDTDKCIFWVQQCCLFYSTDTPHHAGGAVLQGVRCVIHYQIPASVDIYVHRSGRTARGSADGLAVALVAPKEAARYAALQQVQIA